MISTMNVLLTVSVLISLFSFSTGQFSDLKSLDFYPESSNITVVEQWQLFEKNVKTIANTAVKAILPYIMEGSGRMNISSSCMKQGMQLISGVKSIKPWAIRFIDASAKMLDGVFVGSLSSFGVYDECVNTVVLAERGKDKGQLLFRGQYCIVDIKPPVPPKANFYKLDEVLPELKNFSKGPTIINEAAKYAHFFHFLSFKLGLCVPSGCSLEDVDQIVKEVSKSLSLRGRASRCELKEEIKFDRAQTFTLVAYSFAGMFLFTGTLIGIYVHYTERNFQSTIVKIFLCFNMLSNFKKFSNTKSSSDNLSCLHGIRFLCMSWIVLGHTYFNVNYQMFLGLEKVRDYARDFAFQAVTNASVAVDTFYCMGGLLVCYLTIKLVKLEGHQFNIKLYIIHRLWRIMPVYIYVILFTFLASLLGSGPIWFETTNKYIEACYNNWWTNLIFINNFYNADKMCIPQSWYLASDFQLYIAALLILIPMLRWPKVGISLCVVSILASIIYSGVGTYVNDYPPTMLFAHPDPEQRIGYWAHFYFRPFVHVGPYCVGLLAGYLLATRPKLKIPMNILVVGWSLAFISNFSVLYGVHEWNKGVDPSLWEGLLYASLNRTAWAMGIAWMIVCCCTGHGGIINYILSWKAFIPLGRLTFIVYLIHPIVQIAAVGHIRTQLQPDHFLAVWVFLGHLCVTYASAFAGTMLIEAPVMALEKMIFKKKEKNCEEPTTPKKNINLSGTLTVEKNGDIAVIVPKDDEDSAGIDNTAIIYKL